MKTLDEVLFEAPYLPTPWEADALEYLKEYKKDKQIYSYDIARRNLEVAERNDPLTWDELKDMGGKPVWVEYCKTNMDEMDGHIWVIIHTAYEEDEDGEAEIFCNDMCRLQKKWQGKRWQAYRKERK